MSQLDELKKLHDLRSSGAISDDEFTQLKGEITRSGTSISERISGGIQGAEVNTWCMYIHLSQLFFYLVPVVGLVVPIVLWSMKKKESGVIDQHGKLVVNWLITQSIAYFICFILCLVLIGYPLLGIMFIVSVAFPVIGAMKAREGVYWKYPLVIGFLK